MAQEDETQRERERRERPDLEFDPRWAALRYAGTAMRIAPASPREARTPAAEQIAAQQANALACGLVYVGDQLGRIADALRNPVVRVKPPDWD